MTYSTLILDLFAKLDSILQNYVANGYQSLAFHLKEPLAVAIVLYLVLLGYALIQGWIQLSMREFIQSGFKIGAIYTFALHWGHFSIWVVDGIMTASGQLSTWLVDATPLELPHLVGSGIPGALQSILIEITRVGQWIWNQGNWREWGPYLTALVIWIFGDLVLIFGLFEVMLAKVMLALLFVVAPLFISFTLFKSTRVFFDRWVGAIAAFAFLMMFVSAMLALSLSFMEWCLVDLYRTQAQNADMMSFIPVLFVGALGFGLMWRTSGLALSLGGPISMASGSVLAAGTAGGLLGAAATGYQKIQPPAWDKKPAPRENNPSPHRATLEAVQDNLRKG